MCRSRTQFACAPHGIVERSDAEDDKQTAELQEPNRWDSLAGPTTAGGKQLAGHPWAADVQADGRGHVNAGGTAHR